MGKSQSKEEQGQHDEDSQFSPKNGNTDPKQNNGNFKSTNPLEESKSEGNKLEKTSPSKTLHLSKNSQDPQSPSQAQRVSGSPSSKKESPVKPSFDITQHPVYQEHGEKAYQLHTFFENIYQCTFHKSSLERNHDLRLLQNEENKSEEILLFTFQNFEDVIQKILESTSYFQSEEKLIFLHNVYTRLYGSSSSQLTQKEINEIMETSMSYVTSYLISPEVFSCEITQEDAKNPIDYGCVLYDMFYSQLTNMTKDAFLKNLILSLSEDDYEAILSPILKRILRDCLDSNGEKIEKIKRATELLETVLYIDKRVVHFFVNHFTFLPKSEAPAITGFQLQRTTIFGACLSMTSFPDESKVVRVYFNDKNAITKSDEFVTLMRGHVHDIVNFVQRIMEYIMKTDVRYKRNILDWLYLGVSVNDAKQKTYNYGSMISSDGWFTNFLLLLMKFSHKMLDDINKYPSWIEKIDFQFLQQKPLFKNILLINGQSNFCIPDLSKESLIDSPEGKGSQEKYTFLSELLFLTNHALFLQTSTQKKYLELLQKMQKQSVLSGPFSRNHLALFTKKLGYEVQLGDPYLLTHIYKLLTFNIMFMLSSFNTPFTSIQDINQTFKEMSFSKAEAELSNDRKFSLPIYWVENIQEYLLFLRKANPTLLANHPVSFEIAMNFVLMFISKDSCIHNPHLKVKYLQILSSVLPLDNSTAPTEDADFMTLFQKNEYFKENLVKNLCEYFLEIEKTCSNSQFHENYSYKHGCGTIITFLLEKVFPNNKNSFVKKGLEKFSNESPEEYRQFWTITLNDMISLVDEALEKLQEIKSFQQDIGHQAFLIFALHDRNGQTLTFEQNKKLIPNFLSFLEDFSGMLKEVVKVYPDFFFKDAIREKLVVTLNYIVQKLTGKNTQKLKMKAMRNLRFNPETILENIAQVYLRLSDNQAVVQSIVHDERSFDVALFEKFGKTLKKHSLIDEDEIEKFNTLKEKLAHMAKEKHEEDQFILNMKDIPEEFLDPIMNIIMKNPVLLPSSNMVVDQSTIEKHLAVDATDPFNRKPLTKEMLEPQEDLRVRIEEFFHEKKKAKKNDA